MYGSGGIISSAIETAEDTEKSLIKELIIEDLIQAQVYGDGYIDEEKFNEIISEYGELDENDETILHTFDTIDGTKYRKSYEILLDYEFLIQAIGGDEPFVTGNDIKYEEILNRMTFLEELLIASDNRIRELESKPEIDLADYVKQTDLGNYVTSNSLNTKLNSYVTTNALATNLNQYAKSSDVTTTISNSLNNYTNSTALTNKINSFLSNYVTTTSLNSILANLSITSGSNYVTIGNVKICWLSCAPAAYETVTFNFPVSYSNRPLCFLRTYHNYTGSNNYGDTAILNSSKSSVQITGNAVVSTEREYTIISIGI